MKSGEILEKIHNKLKECDPEHRTLVKIFQFHFNDNHGDHIKSFVLDLKDLKVFEGETTEPDVDVTVNDEDFYQVGIHEISFDSLVEAGKVEVKGDLEAFYRLVEKFKLNTRK